MLKHKKLTITVEDRVYADLYKKVGAGKISDLINSLLKRHMRIEELRSGYEAMSKDVEHEKEALEWSEGLIGDTLKDDENDETW